MSTARVRGTGEACTRCGAGVPLTVVTVSSRHAMTTETLCDDCLRVLRVLWRGFMSYKERKG